MQSRRLTCLARNPTRFPLFRALALAACLAVPAQAQIGGAGTISGFPASAPLLRETPPRPVAGPDSVGAFVAHISSQQADAAMEVVLGRPRTITLKRDLASARRPGQILVGDPSIADFDLLGARQIRVYGLRAGITDLTLVTGAGEDLTIRVSVVYDLDTLREQLTGVFPDANVRMFQIREHLFAEGIVRDPAQARQLSELLDAYRASMSALQQTERRQAGPPPPPPGR